MSWTSEFISDHRPESLYGKLLCKVWLIEEKLLDQGEDFAMPDLRDAPRIETNSHEEGVPDGVMPIKRRFKFLIE